MSTYSRSKEKKVYGVGINDADYQVSRKVPLKGGGHKVWTCPIYKTWKRMIERCFSPIRHKSQPTYMECNIADEWIVFSCFRDWAVGRYRDGWQLDKDILVPGNKIYGPEFCVFVPQKLNLFFKTASHKKSGLPIGVSHGRHKNQYKASCRDPFTGKYNFLGYFSNPIDAHRAYLQKKHDFSCAYADLVDDTRLAEALRTRYLGLIGGGE